MFGDCNEWTDADSALTGGTGLSELPTWYWSTWDQTVCSTTAALYCFEQ